jgi:hypothetical protein
MTAPVSFREKVRFFSLAPRAPSIHDPLRSKAGSKSRSAANPDTPSVDIVEKYLSRLDRARWRHTIRIVHRHCRVFQRGRRGATLR